MQLWKLLSPSISPEVIFGGWVTNALLCTWLSIIILFVILYLGIRRRDLIPSGMQNAIEWIIEALQNLVESVAGKERGRRFFPYVVSFFLFILIGNLLDVVPGIDTIGTTHLPGILLWGNASNQLTPWFRPPTTDLNLTIAMAIVSVVMTQYMAFTTLGFKEQISKYLNFRALFRGGIGIVDFFVGLIEIISEIGRIISFSFRLFGNIFAGSVLLAVFAFLVPVLADVIFIPFEIFIGAIQAFVFGFLTLLFMTVATTSHAQHEEGIDESQHEYEENRAHAA